VLQRLEELHVPVHPPPLHPRVPRLQLLDLRAQLLDLLLPGALLAQQRRLHQRAHLLAHLAVHLAQLAVLLHQLLRAAAQLVDVTFELRRIGPRDLLAAARRVRRLLRLRRRRELLEAEGVVEE
jgi:hypothetical protein